MKHNYEITFKITDTINIIVTTEAANPADAVTNVLQQLKKTHMEIEIPIDVMMRAMDGIIKK